MASTYTATTESMAPATEEQKKLTTHMMYTGSAMAMPYPGRGAIEITEIPGVGIVPKDRAKDVSFKKEKNYTALTIPEDLLIAKRNKDGSYSWHDRNDEIIEMTGHVTGQPQEPFKKSGLTTYDTALPVSAQLPDKPPSDKRVMIYDKEAHALFEIDDTAKQPEPKKSTFEEYPLSSGNKAIDQAVAALSKLVDALGKEIKLKLELNPAEMPRQNGSLEK